MTITPLAIAEIGDLTLLAWEIGIVYFQIYGDKPDPDFYTPLAESLAYEQIVEVRAENWEALRLDLGYSGKLPCFGAITGGWVIAVTDDPRRVGEILTEARRQVVLPSDIHRIKRGRDQDLEIEGMESYLSDPDSLT